VDPKLFSRDPIRILTFKLGELNNWQILNLNVHSDIS
jgi:hypothetical protein